MYCPNCGRKNSDRASFCTHCGERLPDQSEQQVQPPSTPDRLPPVPTQVSNYLAQAILVTIFCCWPFGIPAIVYAAQANAKAARGDVAGAQAAASSALVWCWVSFGAGFIAIAAYTAIMIASAAWAPY